MESVSDVFHTGLQRALNSKSDSSELWGISVVPNPNQPLTDHVPSLYIILLLLHDHR